MGMFLSSNHPKSDLEFDLEDLYENRVEWFCRVGKGR